MKNKRGELTSKQLITIIILIVSFAVILIFFISLNLKSNIDSESCRNSVVLKGIPFGKSLVSLKCKTQDVCLSMGGDCSVEKKEIEKISVESESETALLREMAGLMIDCWWMMGEGKVEYSKNKGDCAICHNIYFDEKIREEYADGIEVLELYQYMARDMPNEETSYLYYLYEMSAASSVLNKILQENKFDISKDKINFEKDYVVVTSYQKPPIYVEFNSNELTSKAGCTGYVTES